MDRWTERFTSDGEKAIAIHDGSDFPNVCFEGEREYDVMDALAEYEDLEEQGLLVRLPCKVGDTVYVKLSAYCKTKYAEAQVRDYTYFISCGFCVVVTSEKFDKQSIPFSEFGKSIFLTREEAEKKL